MKDKILKIKNIDTKRFTKFWRKINQEEMEEEGEFAYPPEFLDHTDKILDEFISNLISSIKSQSEEDIEGSIKKLVLLFNKLNDKYKVIHTVLREDICEFINDVVWVSEVFENKKDDVTLEWRNW